MNYNIKSREEFHRLLKYPHLRYYWYKKGSKQNYVVGVTMQGENAYFRDFFDKNWKVKYYEGYEPYVVNISYHELIELGLYDEI